MSSYSIRLACVGLVLGALTFSAAALGAQAGPAEPEAVPAAYEETQETQTMTAQTFYVALRVDPGRDCSHLFLCDFDGCPLKQIEPDTEGDTALGPLAPGRYCLMEGGQVLGVFVLAENAAVLIATDRLWTDGELLYLASEPTGEIALELTLTAPGQTSLELLALDGTRRLRLLRVDPETLPDIEGLYLRTVRFPGLPPGKYTVIVNRRPVRTVELPEGGLVYVETVVLPEGEGK